MLFSSVYITTALVCVRLVIVDSPSDQDASYRERCDMSLFRGPNDYWDHAIIQMGNHGPGKSFPFPSRQSTSSEPIRTAYYFLSLAWLCVRVFSVVLAASDINSHSRQALKHIYTHDTHCYNVEVVRLQDQLSKDYIALSGKGFFYLSKSILLEMAASIITYELMLIQFDDKGTDPVQLNLTKNAIGV